jgi:plastocyanin
MSPLSTWRWTSLAAVRAILASPATAEIQHRSIHNMSFGEPSISAHVGDTIEWTNDDFVAHTVTARDGSFDATIFPGKTGRTVLTSPGKILFFCRFHPNMTGTIDVTP